jgi:hypothetical protein
MWGFSGCYLRPKIDLKSFRSCWLRGLDLNQRPLGYEPNELPDCSTPHLDSSNRSPQGQTTLLAVDASKDWHQLPGIGVSS